MCRRREQKGFSLVELAIVLVIIGLILGAVRLSSGVKRSAEYSSLYSRFILAWSDVYSEFFDRNGFVIGDTLPATGKVDGASSTPSALCSPNLKALFITAGIELPQGRGRGAEELMLYQDPNGNQQQLSVCFLHVTDWYTASGNQPTNVMQISGVTADLARKLDALVDVNSDAAWGDLRRSGSQSSNVTLAWPDTFDTNGDVQTVTVLYRMPY